MERTIKPNKDAILKLINEGDKTFIDLNPYGYDSNPLVKMIGYMIREDGHIIPLFDDMKFKMAGMLFINDAGMLCMSDHFATSPDWLMYSIDVAIAEFNSHINKLTAHGHMDFTKGYIESYVVFENTDVKSIKKPEESNLHALPTQLFANQLLNGYYNIIIMKQNNVEGMESVSQETIEHGATLFCLSKIDMVEYDTDENDDLTFVFHLKDNLPSFTMHNSYTFIPERSCEEFHQFITILTHSALVNVLEKERRKYYETKLVNESVNVIDLKLYRKKRK